MEQNTEQFMEALEVSKKIEEAGGVAQAFKAVGRTIANAFGTAQGNAQRNAKAAQDAQNVAQTNAQTAQTNAQTNAMDDITLAKTITDAATKALAICEKGVAALGKQPQQGEEKPQKEQPQNNQQTTEQRVKDNEAGKNGRPQDVDDPYATHESQAIDFVNALREAAQVKDQAFYDNAKASLEKVQQLVRPFLTGQKKFTDKDIDKVSKLINDQNVQQVLGKSDKKSLKIIQNLNAALNTKKQTLQQSAQPEQPKDPAQGGNPDTQKAGETVDPNTQPAQGTEPAAATAQGDANAQGAEDNKQGVSKEEQQVVNTTTAQAAPQIEAMDAAMEKIKQFSQKSKYIAAAVQEWANFKDALNKTTNANKG